MRITSEKVRQAILTTDSVIDPDDPPESLALFDQNGNPIVRQAIEAPGLLPPGGAINQVPAKKSASDYDVQWVDIFPHDVVVGAALPVLEVGLAGQLRAGRQLASTDFTDMGLSAPRGLWNLSDMNDASGNGRALTNKGGLGFATGINGAANTSVRFLGSAAQALYISDTGAADPFRIATGTVGCWFKTSKRGLVQQLISKRLTSTQLSFHMAVVGNNALAAFGSPDGSNITQPIAASDVCDGRWHFGVTVFDGTAIRIYVDAVLEAMALANGVLFGSTAPLNIGSSCADAATAASDPNFGRIDEAFITADVLSEEQIRNLYCVRIPHALPVTPTRVSLNVRRCKLGATLSVADFPAQPLRLYNFTNGALTDEGINNLILLNVYNPINVAGADGIAKNAYSFATNQILANSDAGLPAALTSRSYGCWFKTISTGFGILMCWGTQSTGQCCLYVAAPGNIACQNGTDTMTGSMVADGSWHHAVVVEDNAALDGIKRRIYVDGQVVANSTTMAAVVLKGANYFQIGEQVDGSSPFFGQIDGVFVTATALSSEDVLKLYIKTQLALAPSPKNSGDHVEALNPTDLLATFDSLPAGSKVDLEVAV